MKLNQKGSRSVKGKAWLISSVESRSVLPDPTNLLQTTVDLGSFLEAQMVKNQPVKWDAQIRSLGWEGLLENGIATHAGILSWRIPWTEEASERQSMGLQRAGHDLATEQHKELQFSVKNKQTKKLGSLKCMAFRGDLRLFSTSLSACSRLMCGYGCQNYLLKSLLNGREDSSLSVEV